MVSRQVQRHDIPPRHASGGTAWLPLLAGLLTQRALPQEGGSGLGGRTRLVGSEAPVAEE